MTDLYFTIKKTDFKRFKTYCYDNNVKFLNHIEQGQYLICKICCELFEYKKLKEEKWEK